MPALPPAAALPVICPGHSRPVVDLMFRSTPDSLHLLMSACHDKMPMLRWADSGNWVGTFKGHSGAVWGCALDEAGLHAATASADFTAKLWDVNTGKELSSLLHEHVVKTCAFSQGKLLTAGLEKKAFVFDVETSRALACLKHEAAVPKAVWHARSGCIITAGGDGYVRLWDVRSASLVSSQQLRAGGAVVDLDLCGDQFVATVGRQFVVCDAQSLDVLQRVDAKVELNSACLSPNSRLVAAGANDLCCHVFDLQSNAAASAPRVLKGHHGPVFSVRWLGSNERLASGSEDGTIRLWSLVS